MTEAKKEFHLTVDFIMIIGKYLESNADFINVMKVCKKYKELVSMYKFNPISDISLFKNIQTQHFYNKQDIDNKKNGLFQYIYWYLVDDKLIKNKKDNEIFKPFNAYKYIINNIPILEEWSGLKYKEILYDSNKDDKSSEIFRNKIINHQHLYFIIIDSDNNVFGHYHNSIINIIEDQIYDKRIFMFSLNSNGRCEIKKFESNENIYTYIYNGNNSEEQFYSCGNDENYDCYGIDKIEDNNGIIQNIENNFKNMKTTDITGNDCSKPSGYSFNPKRLIIIEMEETETNKKIQKKIKRKDKIKK